MAAAAPLAHRPCRRVVPAHAGPSMPSRPMYLPGPCPARRLFAGGMPAKCLHCQSRLVDLTPSPFPPYVGTKSQDFFNSFFFSRPPPHSSARSSASCILQSTCLPVRCPVRSCVFICRACRPRPRHPTRPSTLASILVCDLQPPQAGYLLLLHHGVPPRRAGAPHL